MKRIDINADLGEEPDQAERDIQLMEHISSCNIACGGHAGNDQSMAHMLSAAKQANIAVGAHPSYPDRENFGRVSLAMPRGELLDAFKAQIVALENIAARSGMALGHIKPHGALYNDMARDPELADDIAHLCAFHFKSLKLVGLAHGALEQAAKRHRLDFIAEGFIDRAYSPAKTLVPRSEMGAVLASDRERIAQALSLALKGEVKAISGQRLAIHADSLCLHSDSANSLQTAILLKQALSDNGIAIASHG